MRALAGGEHRSTGTSPVVAEGDPRRVLATNRDKLNQRPRTKNENNHAGRRHMATQSTPNLINTITNASATSFGVAGGDSAAITVTNTAEAANKCTDDGRWHRLPIHLRT